MSLLYDTIEKLTHNLNGELTFTSGEYRECTASTGQQKWRQYYQPSRAMCRLHSRMIHLISEVIDENLLDYAHGSVKGRSSQTNIQPHLQNRYFYVTDLRNAFSCVRLDLLSQFIAQLTGWEISGTTELIRTHFFSPDRAGLVVGGPASPLLFNVYLGAFDRSIGLYCGAHNITYTRYVDDLTFSSLYPMSNKVRAQLRSMVEKAGFNLADHKTHYVDLCEAKGITLCITGISLCWDQGAVRVDIPRKIKRNARATVDHRDRRGQKISDWLKAGRRSDGLVNHARDIIRFAHNATGRKPTPGELHLIHQYLFGK